VAFSLAAFALGTVIVEFRRGASARQHMISERPARALINLVAKNNRRYGGYIIHIGVALAFIAIVGSSFFKTEVKATIKPGGSFDIGPYDLVFVGLKHDETPHLESARAEVEVLRNGAPVAVMHPGKLFYKRPQQPATSVAIRSTPANDLYLVLASIDDDSGLVTFQVFLTPLVFWLWAGGVIMAFGTLIVMWPNVRERAAIAAAISAPVTIEPAPIGIPGGD
jgi:cytochrome c-type biogenesis protein CcmF